MGQFNLDKYFKERISGYSDDIDTDALWTNLDLEEKKKDRGIFWFFFGSMVLIALAALVYLVSFTSDQKTIKNSINKETDFTEESKNSSSTYSENESSINSSENNIINKNKLGQKINSPRAKHIVQNSSSSSSSLGSDHLLIAKIKNEISNSENELNNTAPKQFQSREKSSEPNRNTNLYNIEQKISDDQQLTRLSKLELLKLGIIENESRSDKQIDLFDKLNVKSLYPQSSRSIDIGLHTSYNLARRSISTDSRDELNEFINNKNNSESVLDAIALGSSVRYKFSSGFYTKLGVEALSITERFDYSTESIDSIEIEGVISSYHVSALGDTTAMLGKGTTEGVVTSHWINYNNHRFLNLPISIGYERQISRWSYFLEFGFHLNLIYKFNGKQLNFKGDVTSDALNSSPKNSWVITGGINYELFPKINLYLQPRFQSTFRNNKASSDELNLPISQNYKLYGIQVGLTYSFD